MKSSSYSHEPRKRWRLQVAVRELLWNQAAKRKSSLRELLCVNAAVAARELAENTGSGVCGGVPSAPASVKALRPLRGALKDARP
jgi:hypothetical protein